MSKERLQDFKVFNEFLQRLKESSAMYQTHRTTEWERQIEKAVEKLKQIYLEQAERVEELLKAHELKDLEHQGLVNQLKEKDEQNKRYREAIS